MTLVFHFYRLCFHHVIYFVFSLKTNEDLHEVLLWHDLQFVVLKHANCHKPQPLPYVHSFDTSAKNAQYLDVLSIRALLAVETGIGIPAAVVKGNLFRKPQVL